MSLDIGKARYYMTKLGQQIDDAAEVKAKVRQYKSELLSSWKGRETDCIHQMIDAADNQISDLIKDMNKLLSDIETAVREIEEEEAEAEASAST